MRIAELSSRLAAEALGQLEVGVIAIDNDSRILFSNDVARRLVDECPDIGWREGRLVMARADLAAKLEVSRTAVQAAQVRGLDEAMIGLLMVSVEDGRDELGPGSRPERAIYLHEVARSKPIPEQLIAELFGLSRPEARLSALLCQGLTLQEAAAHMGVTENSARTYSKLAFSNLGVSRQTELVRRIVTSVAMFGNIRSS
jgi:DNA-binding CsgD family transcriptional regulator